MGRKLTASRIAMIRLGDKNSGRNVKDRKYAFEMISAIATVFTPNPISGHDHFQVGRGYIIERFPEGSDPELIVRNNKIDEGEAFYWRHHVSQYPESGMLSLTATQMIGVDIANGWLVQVLKELSFRRGHTIATAFGFSMNVPPILWERSAHASR